MSNHSYPYLRGNEEAVPSPYAEKTISTLSHHASALTINAGLGRGRDAPRPPSLSSAEYDSDRPVDEMISRADAEQSVFGLDLSRSSKKAVRMCPRYPLAPSPRHPTNQDDATPRPANKRTVPQRTPHHRPALRGSSSVVLPDVTGLTSTVESPVKVDIWKADFAPQNVGNEEARILSALVAVQSRLQHLESENGISRRRVRELEVELEACKEDVKRERTRVLEREESSMIRQIDLSPRPPSGHGFRGKDRMFETSTDFGSSKRYREVLEEKKVLEASIASFRAHLKRLTAELSSQRTLLNELQASRDSDVKKSRVKEIEVEKLHQEVERLAGEVEVLKGIVEEGLKERRYARELSQFLSREESLPGDEGDEADAEGEQKRESFCQVHEGDEDETDAGAEQKRESFSQVHEGDEADAGEQKHDSCSQIHKSSDHEERTTDPRSDGGLETDHVAGARSKLEQKPLLDCVELERISVELDDRRSTMPPTTIPATHPGSSTTVTPFPQIRGRHLERLFFSAPEHNIQTCALCHRKRRVDKPISPLRGKHREPKVLRRHEPDPPGTGNSMRGRPPPQTVLVKVLRELEDDFTHHKAVYVELADQYNIMDAISNVPKRNILAQHLKDVVDLLEQKGDQIASLYDLLMVKDQFAPNVVTPSAEEELGSARA